MVWWLGPMWQMVPSESRTWQIEKHRRVHYTPQILKEVKEKELQMAWAPLTPKLTCALHTYPLAEFKMKKGKKIQQKKSMSWFSKEL